MGLQHWDTTFSIVARCPQTGQLGVAVATRRLAVGGRVPFVQPCLGAVATRLTRLSIPVNRSQRRYSPQQRSTDPCQGN